MINTGYITPAKGGGEEVLIGDYPDGKKMTVLRDKSGKIRKAPRARMGTLEQALKFVAYKALNGEFVLKED